MEGTALPKLACLGPLGTYSHQSSYDRFGENVEYVERPTIKAVCESISEEIPFGVIPQENTIFGAVIEAYDVLRVPAVGKEIFVRGEITLPVQHCLMARKGVKFEDVERIVSHEQALGQCSGFIAKHFPNATLEKKTSTAGAARTLLEDDELNLRSAAICSTICEKVFDGLEILRRSVQDSNINYTRFYILSHGLETPLPAVESRPQLRRALVRLSLPPIETSHEPPASVATAEAEPPAPPKPSHSRTVHLVMGTLLTTFGVPVIRLDRRPSINGLPFEDTYFLELEDFGTPVEPSASAPTPADEAWLKRVRMGVERVIAAGGQADVIGVW